MKPAIIVESHMVAYIIDQKNYTVTLRSIIQKEENNGNITFVKKHLTEKTKSCFTKKIVSLVQVCDV